MTVVIQEQDDDLLREVDKFLKATGMAQGYLGLQATNNGHLIPRLRAGGHLKASTEARLRQFMRFKMTDMEFWAKYPNGRTRKGRG